MKSLREQETHDSPRPLVSAPTLERRRRGTPAAPWLVVLGLIAVVAGLRLAQEFLIPVILGVILAASLEPIVGTLARWHIPRALAAALVLAAAVGGTGFAVYALADEAAAVANRLPVAARELRRNLQRQRAAGASPMQTLDALSDEIHRGAAAAASPAPAVAPGVVRVQVEDKPLDLRRVLWRGSLGAVAMATNAVLLLFLTYFLMASGDLFKRKIVAIAGPARRRVTLEVIEAISGQVQGFLFLQLVTGALVALASWATFAFLGLENAAVWALAAGVFNVIPYFGPLLVMTGLFVAALLQFGSLGMVAAIVGSSLVITGLEGLVLRPKLIGRAARMNDVAVFVSLLFWGWLWGIVGLLLAIPLMMLVKTVCDRVDALAAVGELLGDERRPPVTGPAAGGDD